MAAKTQIPRGSNRIINRALQQANGADLPNANILLATVQLIQEGVVLETIQYGVGAKLRAGADAKSFDLELIKATTAAMKKGELTTRYYYEVMANVFVNDAARAKCVAEFSDIEIT